MTRRRRGPTLATCWLFALTSVVLARAQPQPESRAQQGDHPGRAVETAGRSQEHQAEGASRSLGGLYENERPEWLMPVFVVRQNNDRDGYLGGMAIRVSSNFFLAHIQAMLVVQHMLDQTRSSGGPPGMFNFRAPTELDISRQNNESPEYAPMYNWTVAHGIGIYWPAVRPGYHKGRFTAGAESAKQTHPLGKPAPLATRSTRNSACKVLTYGHMTDGGKGTDKPLRKLSSIAVERIGTCENRQCEFSASSKKDDSVPVEKIGMLCGQYSELGAPIVCNAGNVEYIVTELLAPHERTGCTDHFRALEVAAFGSDILSHVSRFDK